MGLRAGTAAVDITPPLSLDVAGNLWTGPSRGVADPLYAKALVLEEGETRVALVALDLLGIERPDALLAANLVADRARIPADHVLISCTHTHYGPATYRRSSVCRWPAEYMEALHTRIAEAVVRANEQLQPVHWGHGSAQAPEAALYRRFIWSDGRVRMPWPRFSRDTVDGTSIVGTAGVIDPTVDVLAFRRSESEAAFAALVSYAAHATCGPAQHWSASYPGQVAAALAPELGLGTSDVLFMPGASGNIEPGSGDAEEVGRAVATEALAAYRDIAWSERNALRARMRPLSMPARRLDGFPAEMVADVYAPWRHEDPLSFARVMRYFANEYLRLAERGDDPHETVLQVVALGDVAIVAIPGEPFTELAIEIKRRSPFGATVVVSMANDTVGYIPDARSFADGGYELIPAWQSRLAPEAGELIVDAAVDLLESLGAEAEGISAGLERSVGAAISEP
jgi:neutral ceramidase